MPNAAMAGDTGTGGWRVAAGGMAGPTRGVDGVRYSDLSIPRRQQLRRLLRNPLARLIVVQGPAGFGKTTLLRQYSDQRAAEGGKVAWIHMEAHAADPGHLVRMLCSAAEEAAGGDPGAPAGSSVQDFATVARRLPRHSVFVIDNLEQASHPGLDAVFTQLVRLLPEGIQLCLSTRTVPSINLPRMTLREQAVVVAAADLRFGLGETSEFLREFRSLSIGDVEDLHRATDGWPAALQCVRLCLRNGRLRRGVALTSGGMTPELIDFLTTSVFEGLSADMQDTLLRACIPERICPELLAAISSAGKGSGDLLGRIEQSGLFLTRADATAKWYRFHNVFRQFLLSRVREEMSTEELTGIHRRSAAWLARNGHLDEAILAYLEAGEAETAAELLSRVIDRLVAEERLAMICRCVNKLPGDVLQRHESVLSAAVIAYSFRREFRRAEQLLGVRRRFLEQTSADRADWGSYNFPRLFMLAAQDRVAEMDAVAKQTLDLLTPADGFKYAVALNAHAYHLCSLSRFEEARAALQEARPLHDEAGSLFGQAYQESIASTVLSARGRIRDAARSLRTALRRVEEAGTGIAAGAVLGAYLAEALYEQNHVDEAESLLDDYAPTVEQQAIVDPLSVAFLTAARIALMRAGRGAAEEVLERAIYLGHRHGLPRAVGYARAELCRMATLAGDLEAAGGHLALIAPSTESDGDVLFHASEAEACTVTRARYLIAAERHAEARALLQGQVRQARMRQRQRRLLKLTLLQALSLNASGETNAARRALFTALEAGAEGGFVRAFLDEGPGAIRLLKEARTALPRMPDLPRKDVVVAHIDHLLREADEAIPVVPEDSGLCEDDTFSPQLFEQLTERERNILKLVAGGFSNRALADRLSVSENTVKWHMRNIFEKLQIKNRMQAVLVARHFGLIDS